MYFKGNAMRFSLRARLHVCVGLAFDTLTHVDQWPLEKSRPLPTDDYYISVYQCNITLECGTAGRHAVQTVMHQKKSQIKRTAVSLLGFVRGKGENSKQGTGCMRWHTSMQEDI